LYRFQRRRFGIRVRRHSGTAGRSHCTARNRHEECCRSPAGRCACPVCLYRALRRRVQSRHVFSPEPSFREGDYGSDARKKYWLHVQIRDRRAPVPANIAENPSFFSVSYQRLRRRDLRKDLPLRTGILKRICTIVIYNQTVYIPVFLKAPWSIQSTRFLFR